MNVRPLHDRIIVRRLEEGEQQIAFLSKSCFKGRAPRDGNVKIRRVSK